MISYWISIVYWCADTFKSVGVPRSECGKSLPTQLKLEFSVWVTALARLETYTLNVYVHDVRLGFPADIRGAVSTEALNVLWELTERNFAKSSACCLMTGGSRSKVAAATATFGIQSSRER